MTTLKERFENWIPSWPMRVPELTFEQAEAVDKAVLLFFRQELLALADYIEFEPTIHTEQQAAAFIRSKANELV